MDSSIACLSSATWLAQQGIKHTVYNRRGNFFLPERIFFCQWGWQSALTSTPLNTFGMNSDADCAAGHLDKLTLQNLVESVLRRVSITLFVAAKRGDGTSFRVECSKSNMWL